jgi:saccharopine dehydrogenase-like NADP-dependent oxidoreductase
VKNVLVFGAGKSSTALIQQLLADALLFDWKISIADANLNNITEKINNHPAGIAVVTDINDDANRKTLIHNSDLVISLLPPHLHILVAQDCLSEKKSLLTASYIDDKMRSLEKEIIEKKILFLCEMGLDPGIDHMSLMELIEDIKSKNGRITSVKSHCGGLVAPESDDNPWHYKISWNPKNVVMAGKAGACYLLDNQKIDEDYFQIFNPDRKLSIDFKDLKLGYYPNRNSIPYIDLYGLQGVDTFMRTTLRYPSFISGWKNLIELKLTDEHIFYETDEMSFQDFFIKHFQLVNFNAWLDDQLQNRLNKSQQLFDKFEQANSSEDKLTTSNSMADQMEDTNTLLKQLFALGIDDSTSFINKGKMAAIDILQYILENKWKLNKDDKDMVVMLHELEYECNGKNYKRTSELVVLGEDQQHTAMAKTVGLPLASAAKLILNQEICATGLLIPTEKSIYLPVLQELKSCGIVFKEKEIEINTTA